MKGFNIDLAGLWAFIQAGDITTECNRPWRISSSQPLIKNPTDASTLAVHLSRCRLFGRVGLRSFRLAVNRIATGSWGTGAQRSIYRSMLLFWVTWHLGQLVNVCIYSRSIAEKPKRSSRHTHPPRCHGNYRSPNDSSAFVSWERNYFDLKKECGDDVWWWLHANRCDYLIPKNPVALCSLTKMRSSDLNLDWLAVYRCRNVTMTMTI